MRHSLEARALTSNHISGMRTIYLGVSFCVLLQAKLILAESDTVVDSSYGYLEGFEDSFGTTKLHVYLGVPYAKPPVGNLRFKRPKEMQPWKGVKSATNYKFDCIQYNETLLPDFDLFNPKTGMSEDCLYLNIWAPVSGSGRPRATLVWIHGGGFTVGTSTVDMYNGKKLAASQDVIVVSMNYRLGPLGFMYNGKDTAPGNMGLLDQQMALHWVKDNIAAFGGDPERITIFGESAGSASVSFHLLSEGSYDLFNNGILQSGVATSFWGYKSPDDAKEMSNSFAKAMNCTDAADMDCLMQLSAEWIIKTPQTMTCPPTVDGLFIKDSPEALLESGKVKKTNIIMGFNQNEGTLFTIGFDWINITTKEVSVTEEQFNTMVEGVLSYSQRNKTILTEAVKFQYKILDWPPTRSYFDTVEQLAGDYFINCDAVNFANNYAASGGNVYMYHLEQQPANFPWPKWTGAAHGIDIFYVFGTDNFTLTEEEEVLSNTMMSFWSNLAKAGNPQGSSLPDWPPYTASSGSYLPLKVGEITPGEGLRARECAFWNTYMPKLTSQLDDYCATDSDGQI